MSDGCLKTIKETQFRVCTEQEVGKPRINRRLNTGLQYDYATSLDYASGLMAQNQQIAVEWLWRPQSNLRLDVDLAQQWYQLTDEELSPFNVSTVALTGNTLSTWERVSSHKQFIRIKMRTKFRFLIWFISSQLHSKSQAMKSTSVRLGTGHPIRMRFQISQSSFQQMIYYFSNKCCLQMDTPVSILLNKRLAKGNKVENTSGFGQHCIFNSRTLSQPYCFDEW